MRRRLPALNDGSLNKRIIIFGKTGQLGWELQRSLAPLGTVHSYGSEELNLTDLKALTRLIRQIKPQILVNAAAYTAVDQAESEPGLAKTINGVVPGVMAEEAASLGSVFIHYSTDYVFDGKKNSPYTETDLTNPLNVYGKTKLEGEQAIRQIGGAFVILRTSWVYSLRGENFVTKVLSWARQKENLQLVTDQIGSPTWARMLAEITCAMLARSLPESHRYFTERSGIYNVGGSGSVSRFDFAHAILRLDPRAGEQIVQRIQPALTADFQTPARRPLATALDCSRFERVFGLHLPTWEECLPLALDE